MADEKSEAGKAHIAFSVSEENLEILIRSVEKIANTYAVTQTPEDKPKRSFIKKFMTMWKSKYFWSLLLAIIAVGGYWLNWRTDITSIQLAGIEKQKEIKQQLQRKINKAVTHARAVVLNQMELCGQSKKTLAELKIERNNVIVDVIALGTGSRYTYNDKTQKKIDEILDDMNGIEDICKLDMIKTDDKYRSLFVQLTELIGSTIAEDNKKIKQLENQNTWDSLLSILVKELR